MSSRLLRQVSAPLCAVTLLLCPAVLLAHGVSVGDKGYIQETFGVRLVPFLYLGAKHMVTGYDHILFLCGVIFYLYRLRADGQELHRKMTLVK